jgi:hypothetical protein
MRVSRSSHGVRCLLAASASFAGLVSAGRATDPIPASARVTSVFAGITCEYSSGQEELARLLAERFAARNREVTAAMTAQPPPVPSTVLPLSPEDLRVNRAAYLAAICAQLALKKPTAWQEECYDAFLNNYESTMRTYQMLGRAMAEGMSRLDKITLWERAELVRRLEGGEKINGFSYDPETKKGNTEFRLPSVNINDPRLKELAEQRKQLTRDYQFKMTKAEGGGTTYQASASSKKQKKAKGSASDQKPEATGVSASTYFPVILTAEVMALPVAEQIERLWDSAEAGSAKANFEIVARVSAATPHVDPVIAGLVLHETTEIGIIDHYYRGKDRRWFCDGVANYVSWRVLRDLHGVELANRTHDLGALLQKYAALREQADLRKWPAAERQSEDERQTPLNTARYIFAERAVALMVEHGGQDILPRLFEEIGKTKPKKVSIKTVEKAWQKLTGQKLDTILAEAVAPPVATPSASADP